MQVEGFPCRPLSYLIMHCNLDARMFSPYQMLNRYCLARPSIEPLELSANHSNSRAKASRSTAAYSTNISPGGYAIALAHLTWTG